MGGGRLEFRVEREMREDCNSVRGKLVKRRGIILTGGGRGEGGVYI